MRYITKHPDPEDDLKLDSEQLEELASTYCLALDEALKARKPSDDAWTDCLRQYEGVPESQFRNTPIENAPNYEVTLGAISSDAIYAQALDTIFNQISPLVTCRATRDDKQLKDVISKFQRWVNHMADFEVKLRQNGEHAALDWGQLGTGVVYVPWTEEVLQTKHYQIKDAGPKVLPIPLEDFIVPLGSYDDLEQMPWVALRFWHTQAELDMKAARHEWDISECVPCGVPGYMRTKREQLARQYSANPKKDIYNILYQIIDVYCYATLKPKGPAYDMLLTIDYMARKVIDYRYQPYTRRPIRYARYQKRAHLVYGLGPLEMLRDYQRQLCDEQNDASLNSRLANMKMFKGKPNAVAGGVVKAYPFKVIETMEPAEFGELKVSDVYPSAYRNTANIINFAERRVGVRELSGPSPANVMGGRTPGITAMTVAQKTTQRFAPAFDDLRFMFAGALIECCFRYREQLLYGDSKTATENIEMVMGKEDAQLVIELLKSPRFEDSVSVEMTASSATVNRVQDRQEAVMLGQYMMNYAQRAVQLFALAGQPNTPEGVKIVAKSIAEVINETIKLTLQTFDTVRDPSDFLLNLEDAVNSLNTDQGALMQLMQLLQQGAAGAQGGGQQQQIPMPNPGQ